MRVKSSVDINYIEPNHRDVHDRLANWGRWAEDRPTYQVCPMFRMARINSGQRNSVEINDYIDVLDALKVEKVVVSLPDSHKRALIWFYVHRYGELQYRRKCGYTQDALQKIVRDGRQMTHNRLTNNKISAL